MLLICLCLSLDGYQGFKNVLRRVVRRRCSTLYHCRSTALINNVYKQQSQRSRTAPAETQRRWKKKPKKFGEKVNKVAFGGVINKVEMTLWFGFFFSLVFKIMCNFSSYQVQPFFHIFTTKKNFCSEILGKSLDFSSNLHWKQIKRPTLGVPQKHKQTQSQ